MVFCDHYLPSFKSGGGMWTVVNLVNRFCDRYVFYVVARNYDSRADRTPFTSVNTDEWNDVGKAGVFYFSTKSFTQGHFASLVRDVKPDAFFLNSVFSTPVIKFLSARRRRLFPDAPVILAPCGELSKGALSIRPTKKKLFLRYARTAGIYRNVIWKASFESEKEEILKIFGKEAEIMIAPDLTPKTILPDFRPEWKPRKEKGSVKFVFLLRLVRIKNIHFFFELLQGVKDTEITCNLIGPLQDKPYWEECRSVIKTLPENIEVNVVGPLPNDEALRKLCESHFFVSPSLGENFGYVFPEALAAGCPLLISDRVVWEGIEEHGAGWSIPLENKEAWLEKINYCTRMDEPEYTTMSNAARKYALEWLANPENEEATAKVLRRALNETVEIVSNAA